MTLLSVNHFDEIVSDLRYAKEFKTPYVLFTSTGQCIGIGENNCFIKIETFLQKDCWLKNIILETKGIAPFLKLVDANPGVKFDFIRKHFSIYTPYYEFGIGLHTSYTENGIRNFLSLAESCSNPIYTHTFSKDDDLITRMKNLKADDGAIQYTIDNMITMFLHKKILNYKAADVLQVSVYKTNLNFSIVRFDIIGKKTYSFSVYTEVLNV